MDRNVRKFVVSGLVVLGMMVSGLSTARALDLAIFDIVAQSSGVGNVTGVRVTISDQLSPIGPPAQFHLFENYTFTPADAGSTFIINSSDPDFAAFKQIVTNGVNDGFAYFVDNLPDVGGSGTGWTEANLFAAGTHPLGPGNFTSIGQLSGPDYAGYDITSVALTINTYTLSSGSGSYSLNFQATAKIVAAPEPGCAGLLLLGATTLGLIRRRKV